MRSSLVVIPTYNEAESIGEVLNALKHLDCDVLVIDDGSPDGTAQIVRGL
jgi:dolichol-phosphate mannosyltransferase